MTTHARAKRRFLEALEMDASQRRALLEQLRDEDAGLHGRVADLLAGHERAESAAAAAAQGLWREPEETFELPAAFGGYELLEEIARGGSGAVYRARQLELGRTVAVKLLRAGPLATAAEVLRFRVEAEVAARLDHPAIVPVYEVGSVEGRHFISMKLIDGPSLDRSIGRFRDPRAAAALVARIARAVDHGHAHGVLHRDIKPSNVLLDRDGRPHVADFGTAKLLDDSARRTATGQILGTPSYMPPEQVSGSAQVSVASDVYALGCVLYELLVGRPPFVADDLLELLRQVREVAPQPLRALRPDVHRDLETICHACIAKEPARRYGSALALAEDLERWLAREPIRARPTKAVERLWLAWRRRPLVGSLAGAVALLLVALVAGAIAGGARLAAEVERKRVAEELALAELRGSLLAQARLVRRAGQAGQRTEAIELLRRAGAIRPGKDLADAAVASLALPDLVTLRAFPRSKADESIVRFDRSLERYVVGRLDGEVELRSTHDGALLATMPGNGQPAWRADFSPDGRYLALSHHARGGGGGQYFAVWDLERSEIVSTLSEVPAAYVDLAPDRPALAFCRVDGEARAVWERDLASGELRRLNELPRGLGAVAVRYSPGGEHLAVCFLDDPAVRVYGRSGGEPPLVLEGPQRGHTDIAWSSSGRRLAAGSYDLRAYVWDARSGALVATLEGHHSEVAGVAFLRDDLLATYGWDGRTMLWDLRDGRKLLESREELRQASPIDGLIGSTTDGEIRVRRVLHEDVLRSMVGHLGKAPNALAITRDDRLAASAGRGEVLLWDLVSGERLDSRPNGDVRALCFDDQGALYVGSHTGLERWQVEGGRFAGPALPLAPGRCESLAMSADGRVLACELPEEIRLFFPREPGRESRVELPPSTAALALSPDGSWLAAGSWQGSGVRLWSAAEGFFVAHLLPQQHVCFPSFSPSGRELVVAAQDGYHMFRTGSWELVWHSGPAESRAGVPLIPRFSTAGPILAASPTRWHVGLLDARSGAELLRLEPPGSPDFAASGFTSDGERLLVSGIGRVHLWELGRLRQELSALGLDQGLATAWADAAGDGR